MNTYTAEDIEEIFEFDKWFISDSSIIEEKDYPPEEFLEALGKATREDHVKWLEGTSDSHKFGRGTRFYTTYMDHRVCFRWTYDDGVINEYARPEEIRIDDCTLCNWGRRAKNAPTYSDIWDCIYRRRDQIDDALYYKRLKALKSL